MGPYRHVPQHTFSEGLLIVLRWVPSEQNLRHDWFWAVLGDEIERGPFTSRLGALTDATRECFAGRAIAWVPG